MAFIKESLADVREPKAADEGEYDLRIVKADGKPSKKGQPMCTVMIIIDNPGVDAPPFYEYLMGWNDDTPEDQIRMRKLTIKRFCVAFDVQEDFDVSDLPGRTARANVKQEVGDDQVVRNRLVLPRIKD